MEVWLFGNPDLPEDSLPLKLTPRLKKEFPATKFQVLDPLDEWDIPDKLFIIDTVQGVDLVSVFTSLEAFQQAPNVTMHDFDLGTQLQFLKKLGKLPKSLYIFGIPPHLKEGEAFTQLVGLLLRYGL